MPIIEESQKLHIAAMLAKAGRKVTVKDNDGLLLAVQQHYGRLFQYESSGPGDFAQQPHSSALEAESYRESGNTRPLH